MRVITESGAFHKRQQEMSQDIVKVFENDRIEIVAVADGVSTCSRSRQGALIAVDETILFIRSQYDRITMLPDGWTATLVRRIQRKLLGRAALVRAAYEDYSTTLMVAVREKQDNKLFWFSIGDGLILLEKDNCFRIVSRYTGSGRGCPVITTKGIDTFIQEHTLHLSDNQSVLLMTDGAWEHLIPSRYISNTVQDELTGMDFKTISESIQSKNPEDDWSVVIMGRKAVYT